MFNPGLIVIFSYIDSGVQFRGRRVPRNVQSQSQIQCLILVSMLGVQSQVLKIYV